MHQCVCKSVYMHLSVYITVNMTEKKFSASLYMPKLVYIFIYLFWCICNFCTHTWACGTTSHIIKLSAGRCDRLRSAILSVP